MKKILLVIFAFTASIILFACKPDPVVEKEIHLSFAAWGDKDLNLKLIDAFEDKYPNITVKYREDFTSSGGQFTQDLEDAAIAGTLPDVFITDNVPTVANKDLTLDISEYWDEDDDAKKVYPNIASTAVYGENRFAIPAYQFLKGILINLDIFEKANLTTVEGKYRVDKNGYPVKDWNYDEMIEIAKAVKKIPVGYANPNTSNTVIGLEYWYGTPDFQQIFPMLDDKDVLYDSYDGTKFNYTSDAWKDAMTKKVNFYRLEDGTGANFSAEVLKDNPNFATYITDYLIGTNKAAMKIEGSWEFQQITLAAKNNINLGFWPYPGGDAGQFPPTILDYMCVASQTANPKEAFLLAKWMTYGQDGWNARLDILEDEWDESIANEEVPKYLDRFPIADYDGVWDRVYGLVDGIEGIDATINNLQKAKPDFDKWMPGYKDFWGWVNDEEEHPYRWVELVALGETAVATFALEWETKINELIKKQMDILAAK